MSISYNDFKAKYLGKFVDQDGVYSAQCVDLVKQWIADNGWPMKKGNAIDWVNNADDFYHWVANSATAVPVQGDIIIFSVGQYGHIGVVESANVNTVDVLNQNWPHGNTTDPVIVTRFNYITPKVVGWLHPVALDTPVTPPTDPHIAEIDRLNAKVSELSVNIETASKALVEAQNKITSLNSQIEIEQAELIEANRDKTSLLVDNGDLKSKVDILQRSYDTTVASLKVCNTTKEDLLKQKADWFATEEMYQNKYYMIPRGWFTNIINKIRNK